MENEQEFNRNQGESRTQSILSGGFLLEKRSVDIDGADLLASIRYDSNDLNNFYNRIRVRARIQAKYFKNSNEVIIARRYVENEEGIRRDFFALLHSDDTQGQRITYFFTAHDIKNEFKLRIKKKNGEQYFVFRLTKNNQYESFKNIDFQIINRRIEVEIKNIEEYVNQKYFHDFSKEISNPTIKIYQDSNEVFFNEHKNKNVLDKLYQGVTYYHEFRRMTAWRIVDKISFRENPNTSTFYDQFTINTNNFEIINVLENIVINERVVVKNKMFFQKVENYENKLNEIIEILNKNGISRIHYLSRPKDYNILKKEVLLANSPNDLYYFLNFYGANKLAEGNKFTSNTSWGNMESAFTFFMLGKYDQSKNVYLQIQNDSFKNQEFVVNFFATYNLRLIAFHNWEHEYPNLNYTLNNIVLSADKKEILKSLIDDSILRDYAKSIEENYYSIKGIKHGKVVQDTYDEIRKLYAKLWEYQNFIDGNLLLTNCKKEFEVLAEKVLEAAIISYSLKTEVSSHIRLFDDFLIVHAIHFCEPNNLFGFLQSNNVYGIDYQSERDFFTLCVQNFFSKNNIDYIRKEATYFDGKTKNPDFRRKIVRIFGNICILLAHLNFDKKLDGFIPQVAYFLDKIDFSIHDLSFLALPIFDKPYLFSEQDLIRIIKIVIKKEKGGEGYLLTNCLLGLAEKEYCFDKRLKKLVSEIIILAVEYPQFEALKVLPKIVPNEELNVLKNHIFNALNTKFSSVLYYHSVIYDLLDNPLDFIDEYFKYIQTVIDRDFSNPLFNHISPYTGINKIKSGHLNRFVEIIFKINDHNFIKNEVVKNVMKVHPYYNFLLNLDSFKAGTEFSISWLLENQSPLLFKKIKENNNLLIMIKEQIKETKNKEIMMVYIHSFS